MLVLCEDYSDYTRIMIDNDQLLYLCKHHWNDLIKIHEHENNFFYTCIIMLRHKDCHYKTVIKKIKDNV